MAKMMLEDFERPSQYINGEWNAYHHRDPSYRTALIYPDTYEVGQPNQAIAILYDLINTFRGGEVSAERAYLPWIDMITALREEGRPLLSLESATPLKQFDMLGITLPHELAATNVLELLDLAGIPLYSSERDNSFPLIVGGGPVALSPEPLAPFFDLFVIGEGEDVTLEVIDAHRALKDVVKSKQDLLGQLASIEGVYIPSLYEEHHELVGNDLEDAELEDTELMENVLEDAVLDQAAGNQSVSLHPSSAGEAYGAPTVVRRRIYEEFASAEPLTAPLVPYTEIVHDRFTVEILRGCARGCRFCQAGMMYRPVRERSADDIVAAVCTGLANTGYDEFSLTSLSSTDHSQLESILRRLNRRLEGSAVGISLPSQRLDSFGVDMARLVAGNKKGGLTFAPEAGTQRMRDVINKGISEEDLTTTVSQAFNAGWRRLKLYFMIGLPGETDEDVKGIAELVQLAYNVAREETPPGERSAIKIGVSVSVFVPKAHTPFQWDGQISPEEIKRRQALLVQALDRREIQLSYHDGKTSCIEAVLSRGGRQVARLVEAAWRRGARFDAWHEQFSFEAWTQAAEELGMDLNALAAQNYPVGAPLPWSHISVGVSPRFLEKERARADAAVTTEDCTFGSCSACGVCDGTLKNTIAGGSRG